MEARRQYGIGFKFVPWGDVIEKEETNVIIVKKNLCCLFEKKPTNLYESINCIK